MPIYSNVNILGQSIFLEVWYHKNNIQFFFIRKVKFLISEIIRNIFFLVFYILLKVVLNILLYIQIIKWLINPRYCFCTCQNHIPLWNFTLPIYTYLEILDNSLQSFDGLCILLLIILNTHMTVHSYICQYK